MLESNLERTLGRHCLGELLMIEYKMLKDDHKDLIVLVLGYGMRLILH